MSILEGFTTSGRLVTVKLLIVLLDVQSSLHCILVIPAQGKFTYLVTPGSQGTKVRVFGVLCYPSGMDTSIHNILHIIQI